MYVYDLNVVYSNKEYNMYDCLYVYTCMCIYCIYSVCIYVNISICIYV